MKDINVVVVGLGWMGSHYARIAKQAHNANLVAVCDLASDTANTLGLELEVPAFTEARAMYQAHPEINAAIIVTPEPFHFKPVREAVEAGINILLEKPVAMDMGEAWEIVRMCKKAGLTLGICHHMRYDPRYTAVRDAIAAGEIGQIVHMFARRNLVVWSPQHLSGRIEIPFWTGVHDIDMMNWMTGKRVVKVTARGRKEFLKQYDVHDVIVSILEYEDGTIAVLENSWATPTIQGRPRAFVLEVRGTKGAAEVAGYETGAQLFLETSSRPLDTYYRMNLNGTWVGPYRDLAVDYFEALRNGRQPLITGEDGLASTLVADAIMRSVASGKTEFVNWDEQ